MEENKIPTPPSGMRKMPPPPPPTKPQPPRPQAPQTQAEPKVDVQKSDTAGVAEQVELPKMPNAEQKSASKTSIAEANGVAQIGSVEEDIVEGKKLAKEKKKKKSKDDPSDIDIVDVRHSKKVDGKVMFYYVGIFVSLALIALMIFLILK